VDEPKTEDVTLNTARPRLNSVGKEQNIIPEEIWARFFSRLALIAALAALVTMHSRGQANKKVLSQSKTDKGGAGAVKNFEKLSSSATWSREVKPTAAGRVATWNTQFFCWISRPFCDHNRASSCPNSTVIVSFGLNFTKSCENPLKKMKDIILSFRPVFVDPCFCGIILKKSHGNTNNFFATFQGRHCIVSMPLQFLPWLSTTCTIRIWHILSPTILCHPPKMNWFSKLAGSGRGGRGEILHSGGLKGTKVAATQKTQTGKEQHPRFFSAK
jgi:hypothetical protein